MNITTINSSCHNNEVKRLLKVFMNEATNTQYSNGFVYLRILNMPTYLYTIWHIRLYFSIMKSACM